MRPCPPLTVRPRRSLLYVPGLWQAVSHSALPPNCQSPQGSKSESSCPCCDVEDSRVVCRGNRRFDRSRVLVADPRCPAAGRPSAEGQRSRRGQSRSGPGVYRSARVGRSRGPVAGGPLPRKSDETRNGPGSGDAGRAVARKRSNCSRRKGPGAKGRIGGDNSSGEVPRGSFGREGQVAGGSFVERNQVGHRGRQRVRRSCTPH